MCEIYGAYGWNTGVRLMKYLSDHFLVRGINQYVPHAFSPKDFPDPDCPPHFYAHGNNPQYRHFGKLMRYLNRMCHLFNGGTHVAPVALLYHAEAEWTGKYMYLQKPARQLLEHQIDFDVLPADLFVDMSAFNASFDGLLRVNGETFRAFVVPYAQFITCAVARFASKAAQAGFPVLFVDGLPEGISDACTAQDSQDLVRGLECCAVVHLADLAEELRRMNLADISIEGIFPRLRYYHYVKDGQDAYMFSNEDPSRSYRGALRLPHQGNLTAYDAMENVLRPLACTPDADGTLVQVELHPYESIVLVCDGFEGIEKKAFPSGSQELTLSGPWTLSIAKAKEYPGFHDACTLDELHSVGKLWPDFSGFMRYETSLQLADAPAQAALSIQDAYEGVEVWVNEAYAGMKICPPYVFDLSGLLKAGQNQVRIEVANTLYRQVSAEQSAPNFFGARSLVVEPSGIVGKVRLHL
jgi:hypothetical protein